VLPSKSPINHQSRYYIAETSLQSQQYIVNTQYTIFGHFARLQQTTLQSINQSKHILYIAPCVASESEASSDPKTGEFILIKQWCHCEFHQFPASRRVAYGFRFVRFFVSVSCDGFASFSYTIRS